MCQFCIDLRELENEYILTSNYLKDAQDFNVKYKKTLKMNANYNYSILQNIDSEDKTLNLLGIAYNMKQIIHFNDDGFDDTFGPIKDKDLPKSTSSQYRSHALPSIINLEKEEENYIDSYSHLAQHLAAVLAENDEIREAINSILREITKEKGKHEEIIVSEKKQKDKNGKAIRKTTNKKIDFFVRMKGWKVSNEVKISAFEIAFPNAEIRITFARNLLDYYNACVAEFTHIEQYIEDLENEILENDIV
ncbi:hypothetical protein F8M41_003479 [Gigaspora margarita]|uniref:Uncharacterized protein n=1 Tax=Gigaspora margarita TaxID=4874 RepID=A0A8H3XBA5_GIGMA|nr:hypothetical protein F8M41_003479 [Gigaspora margarita]